MIKIDFFMVSIRREMPLMGRDIQIVSINAVVAVFCGKFPSNVFCIDM